MQDAKLGAVRGWQIITLYFLTFFSVNDALAIVVLSVCVLLLTATMARNIEGTEIVNKGCVQSVCRILEVLSLLYFYNSCNFSVIFSVILFIWSTYPNYTKLTNVVGSCI